MIILFALSVLAAAPGVDCTLAPDQPIPHVYTDDPLIIEFLSEREAVVSAHIEAPNGGSFREGPLELSPGRPLWLALEEFARLRGRYTAAIRVTEGEDSWVLTRDFCRIDRPVGLYAAPVAVNASQTDAALLYAASSVQVGAIRIPADAEDAAADIEASTDAGLTPVVVVNASGPASIAVAESLARIYGSQIARWDIRIAADAAGDLPALRQALHSNGARPVLAPVVAAADVFAGLMSSNVAEHIDAVVLEQAQVEDGQIAILQRITERAGVESLPVGVCWRGSDAPRTSRLTLVERIIASRAAGADENAFASELVYGPEGFGRSYVELAACNRLLHGSEYVGELEAGDAGRAYVFRSPDRWLIAAWGAAGSGQLTVDAAGASDLRLADENNNPRPVPQEEDDGTLVLELRNTPLYLSGRGGSVVSSAAAPAVAKEARQLVADRHTAAFLPEELAAILDDLAERPRESVDRESLLLLLRTFSYLEREWSGGGMPTEAAVPAMAGLARLIRALGPIEQERGEPFVEPLTNVLAQTSDFVADYMTRSTGQEQEGPRGEWLVAEIGKLTARAEELNGAGRSVEASLLAHMAKWRARSLQYAVGRSSIERPSAEVLLTGYTPPDEEPAPDGDEEQPLSAEEREAPEAASASEASAGTDNGEAASATPAGEEQVFEVRPGENPSVIAGKHGVALEDLLSWNGWSKRVVLQVGDEYVVKKKAP